MIVELTHTMKEFQNSFMKMNQEKNSHKYVRIPIPIRNIIYRRAPHQRNICIYNITNNKCVNV